MASSDDGKSTDGGVQVDRASSADEGSKKRKRDTTQTSEIEIDVSLPEPPSKKALRKSKRHKSSSSSKHESREQQIQPSHPDAAGGSPTTPGDDQREVPAASENAAPSPYCVWIGNLPFTATKAMLRTFLTSTNAAEYPLIPDTTITRIHIPPPTDSRSKGPVKPQNKGFAYVDLSTETAFNTALALSESPLGGRRLLIKSGKDFTGRPEKPSVESGPNGSTKPGSAEQTDSKSKKPPMRRVFVGNLGFDVTRQDLQSHFAVCGGVDDIFMATFEDTGKCKGYAWVTFETIEGASDAVKGWTYVQPQDDHLDDSDGSDEEGGQGNGDEITDKKEGPHSKKKPAKKAKPRKWFVNRLQGRTLRCEFAEDPETRYKKRFSKQPSSSSNNSGKRGKPSGLTNGDAEHVERPPIEEVHDAPQAKHHRNSRIQPGAPTDPNMRRGRATRDKHAMDDKKYRTGGIVRSTGTKVTFD